mmetsp:Transcript_5008/g.11242  ORF Transcript_5008/g.11242 Transcript_5008/m.11242 type:complete len:81 (-) Transcript_5008:209-451(-)
MRESRERPFFGQTHEREESKKRAGVVCVDGMERIQRKHITTEGGLNNNNKNKNRPRVTTGQPTYIMYPTTMDIPCLLSTA